MIINAKYRGYCNRCFYTIFKNERCVFNGKVYHMDCEVALTDKYNRSLNPLYKRRVGKVRKNDMLKIVQQREQLPNVS